ncbi:hypothetical protein [Methylobacterium gnaphalii]|uniref:Uncharacterized protein n=1 Tax=Methylobacterium gnaphalii TaxID=1010610 RepID=A0A512JPD5_9HYPH|nr:hypothetical protein [Methylobacterium gnaphalii]GEP11723.1 hypothetical protein MGN01_35680 [Methylobacterium gnaphalii]GLS50220.1 hypothetical protein GCM10007885_30720 [Methylobacterium gnaphalii]
MKIVAGIVLAVLCSGLAQAQSRGALLCSEDMSFKPKEHPAADGSLVNVTATRRYSLVWSYEYLNLISAGKTEFFECIRIKPRLNEAAPRNSIKCQNGVYFITIDLTKFTFVRANLDPQNLTNVELAHGSCKLIGS